MEREVKARRLLSCRQGLNIVPQLRPGVVYDRTRTPENCGDHDRRSCYYVVSGITAYIFAGLVLGGIFRFVFVLLDVFSWPFHLLPPRSVALASCLPYFL